MGVPIWLPYPTEIRATPARAGWKAVAAGSLLRRTCGNSAPDHGAREAFHPLGSLPLGRHQLTFHVEIELGSGDEIWTGKSMAAASDFLPGLLWAGDLELAVEIVPTLHDVLTATHDAALTTVVRRAFRIEMDDEGSVELIADRERVPELDSTMLSFDFDLLENGTSVNDSRHLLLREPSVFVSRSNRAKWYVPGAYSELTHLSLRVRGGSRDALHSLKAERYWDGEFVIPLADLPRH